MNDKPLDDEHGAPLRLRVDNQLGFKQVKWIKRSEFVKHYSDQAEGFGRMAIPVMAFMASLEVWSVIKICLSLSRSGMTRRSERQKSLWKSIPHT
jgi:DMSO/TMAO reductase YedYZ molybdopterin-dependent catalytic subunit